MHVYLQVIEMICYRFFSSVFSWIEHGMLLFCLFCTICISLHFHSSPSCHPHARLLWVCRCCGWSIVTVQASVIADIIDRPLNCSLTSGITLSHALTHKRREGETWTLHYHQFCGWILNLFLWLTTEPAHSELLLPCSQRSE